MGKKLRANQVSIRSENAQFQQIEALKRNREKRNQLKEFLLEGVSQITLAVKHGWEVRAFLYSNAGTLSSWAQKLLAETEVAQHIELTPTLMDKLSDKEEPSELLALVRLAENTTERITLKNNLVCVFDRPSSPGNLGSSIRSADAFGADAVIITGHAVDMYDPHVVRGSMGALFALPVIRLESQQQVAEWVAAQRAQGVPFQIIGTSGKAEKFIGEVSFTKPTVLVMGNETVGMSKGYWDICDAVVKIPIGGALSSLNVSCATTVCLYEIARQRAETTK